MPDKLIEVWYILSFGIIACLIFELLGSNPSKTTTNRSYVALVAILAIGLADYMWLLRSPGFQWSEIVSIASLSLAAILAIIMSILQMRHMKMEKSDCFAILMCSLVLACVIQTHFHPVGLFAIGVLWQLTQTALLAFRSSRRVTSELAGKMMYLCGFWLIAGFTALVLTGLLYQFSFETMWQAASMHQPAARMLVSLWLLLILILWGAAPLHFVWVDYLEGAPSFAGIFHGVSSFQIGAIVWQRFTAQADLPMHDVLLVLAGLALLLPTILASAQTRVARSLIYILLSQTGLSMCLALISSAGRIETDWLSAILLVHQSVACAAVLGGIQFWKHLSSSGKTWEQLSGGGKKHPVIATIWLLSIASLAGLPGTMGFYIKMKLVSLGLVAQQPIIAILVFGSIVLGAIPFYRLTIFLFGKQLHYQIALLHRARQTAVVIGSGVILGVCGLALIVWSPI